LIDQISAIVHHAVILSNLYERNVSVNEAGIHWSLCSGLAEKYRELARKTEREDKNGDT
jgi:hypothetical protein